MPTESCGRTASIALVPLTHAIAMLHRRSRDVAGTSAIEEYTTLQIRETGRGADSPRTLSGRIRAGKLLCQPAQTAKPGGSTPTATAAATRQNAQLPAFAPLLEELEIAGWSSHRRMLSGNFHDWLPLEGRKLLVMAGQAVAVAADEAIDPMEAALVAQGAWAAIRSHAQHSNDAGTLLSLAAHSLWSNVGVGLQAAVALVDMDGGRASVAVAGDCLAIRVRAAGAEPIAARQPALGAGSDFTYLSHSVQLSLRERILLIVDEPQRRPAKLAARVATSFSRLDAEAHRRMMAADAIAIVRQEYELAADEAARPSASIVAVRRR